MMVFAVLSGIVVIAFVTAPFFVGRGGVLAEALTVDSKSQLQSLKDTLLQRFLMEEAAAAKGEISPRTWSQRQQFLINRYIDAARRLDFLEALDKAGQNQGVGHA